MVLALAEEPARWRYGYELCQRLDLEAGSLYLALMRLADRGLLETAWESEVPAGRLTGPGRVLAGDLAAGSPNPAKAARAGGAVGREPRLGGT